MQIKNYSTTGPASVRLGFAQRTLRRLAASGAVPGVRRTPKGYLLIPDHLETADLLTLVSTPAERQERATA